MDDNTKDLTAVPSLQYVYQDNKIMHKKSFYLYLNFRQLQWWFIFKIINKSEP